MINPQVFVTQPYLPPLEEFIPYLEKIWERKILTNDGPFHSELEQALCSYLGVNHISLFSNGTLALITALHALRITGEVITTPFSFVATTHALWWNGITPVFVDIDEGNFNIDPEKIEAAITPKTTAILPVHVYGTPCNLERINEIAEIYGLKVIYDACHAFGVKKNGQSVLNFGDLSVLSFHATKVYNTFEGGAIVCPDEKMKHRIDHLKNFGFVGETTVVAPGINAKMNEFQAALGLVQLKHLPEIMKKRKQVADLYRELLTGIDGVRIPSLLPDVEHNNAYFPVFIDGTKFPLNRDEVYHGLKEIGVNSRRYFYPLISNFPIYKSLPSSSVTNLPVANMIASQAVCLPMYPTLDLGVVETIAAFIRNAAKRK